MLAYFGERISPHMTDTPEGFLICHDVPIGRTGEMEYLARELGLAGDPERLVRVSRDEGEVFAPAALASFEGKPVTDGHPPETVRPENAAAYHKGHVQNVRREGDYLTADLHITDPVLISEVKSGAKREVSCGYSCVYEPFGEGRRQRHIRGNHVAIVPKGRAGHEVAIKDEAQGGTDDEKKGRIPMRTETKKALFRAFGLAARDVEPEELEKLTDQAAKALDGDETDRAGTPSELEQKVDGLVRSVDRILELLEPGAARDEAPEERLDRTIAGLCGGGESAGAEVIGASVRDGLDGEFAGTAARILKSARGAIAAMKDPGEKQRVADALLSSIRGADPGGPLLAAAQSAARQNAQDCGCEGRITAQQAAYNARNPHRRETERPETGGRSPL